MAHAASQIIWPYFGQLDADMVRTKSSDTDFVTIADTRAEQYLSSSLLPLIEGADIIGEESTSQTGAIPKTLSDGYIWVVDPLDGTRNFVNKINRICSMITLLHEGVPQAAWIYRIAEKDCFSPEGVGGYIIWMAQHIKDVRPQARHHFLRQEAQQMRWGLKSRFVPPCVNG